MRLDEVGRGKGDEESGSKAGSNEGFGANSSRCSSGSRDRCGALVRGEESMSAAEGRNAHLGDVSSLDMDSVKAKWQGASSRQTRRQARSSNRQRAEGRGKEGKNITAWCGQKEEAMRSMDGEEAVTSERPTSAVVEWVASTACESSASTRLGTCTPSRPLSTYIIPCHNSRIESHQDVSRAQWYNVANGDVYPLMHASIHFRLSRIRRVALHLSRLGFVHEHRVSHSSLARLLLCLYSLPAPAPRPALACLTALVPRLPWSN